MPIPPVTGNTYRYADMAKKYGMQIMSVPLKENQHAELLFKNNTMNAYVFDGGKLIGGGGFRADNPLRYSSNAIKLFSQLGELGANLKELTANFNSATLRNVK